VRIAFVYAGGRESRWRDALAGKVPTDFFYGAVELAKAGHDVACIDAPTPTRSLLAAAYNALLDWRTPVRTRGEHIAAIAAILPRLTGVDAIVAASTSHANALALWKGLGRVRAPIAGIHCGHVNFQLSGARRRSTARALKAQEVVLFAEAEREETIRQFHIDDRKIHANPFGVDVNFWTPSEEEREFILSVGNDGRRDYATLLGAVEGVNVPVRILTARELPALPANVTHLQGSWHSPAVTDGELRDLYRRARIVVVPLADSLQPSGQSVALQAMACGRPVIMTRTRGLWIADDFASGREILLVEPSSPSPLRKAIEDLIADPAKGRRIGAAARDAVLRNGRIDGFAARLEAILGTITT
jgi:glycosyltransferase involved in cell wall biosynthesis